MASRAKEEMIIIKSFNASDITNDKNENTYIFKSFISYAEQTHSNSLNEQQAHETIPNNLSIINQAIDRLANELSLDKNLVIQKHKRIGTHVIDLAISKINESKISLCVLIDDKYQNEQYSKDTKNWIKNIDRQKYYEDRGYNTYRLNLLEFNVDYRNILNHLKQQIV